MCFSQNSKKCSVKLNEVEVVDKVKIEDLSDLHFSCPNFDNEKEIKIRVAYTNKDKLVKENERRQREFNESKQQLLESAEAIGSTKRPGYVERPL